MTREEAAKKIEAFLRERFDVAPDDPDFDGDVHLFDYGYVDSFGAVDLTLFVETTFGISIEDSDFIVHPLNTINEIATFAVRRASGEV